MEKQIPDQEHDISAGEHYKALIPDTLDLAERADYAINALIGQAEPAFDYECWWLINVIPPSIFPHSHQWFDQNPRNLWSLTLLRLVNGSTFGEETERKMMESMFARVGDGGLFYNAPFDNKEAWWRGGGACREKWSTAEDFACLGGQSMMLNAMTARYLRDGDVEMRARGQKLADELSRIVITKDDYAYYPATTAFGADYAHLKESGWPDTREAASDQDDPEGSVTCYQAIAVSALSHWYTVTGDKNALETAGKLVRYILKPQFWTGGLTPWMEEGSAHSHNASEIRSVHGGAERKPAALFQGHQAGMTYTFTGLIDYAIAANDAYVKDWVRQGYEYFRNLGLHRIGMWGENIANNQMAEIAIKLSDSGAGDYWEDVDQYVRNAFVEDQFIDLELLKQECEKRGLPTRQATKEGEFSLERFLGCLRHEGLIDTNATLDPTQNGAKRWFPDHVLYGSCYMEAFYFVWEAITRYREGSAQVNLLLNRASAWLDIDSHLPYEGKVVLRNKTCKSIYVRIPKWIDRRKISCKAGETPLPFSWAGNFLILTDLIGTEMIEIKFPMVETTETYYLLTREVGRKWWERKGELPEYVLHMKGNTCVKIEFTNREKFTQLEPVYPAFQRDHLRADKAPLKMVSRYVARQIVEW